MPGRVELYVIGLARRHGPWSEFYRFLFLASSPKTSLQSRRHNHMTSLSAAHSFIVFFLYLFLLFRFYVYTFRDAIRTKPVPDYTAARNTRRNTRKAPPPQPIILPDTVQYNPSEGGGMVTPNSPNEARGYKSPSTERGTPASLM